MLTLATLVWIAVNLTMGAAGRSAYDQLPFQWLQDAATLGAPHITVLILITQRRENDTTEQPEQITFQLALF